jgi:hypothetical protein
MGAFLDSLATDTPDNYPRSILTDPVASDELAIEIDINPDQRFLRRFEAAEYLYQALAPLRTTELMHLERDRRLWTWLALLWFEQLCPADQHGRFKPKDRSRYIPLLEARRYYRHLLLGPYLLYRIHAQSAEIVEPVLCGPLTIATGEAFRTIIETQQFVTSAPVIKLIGRLYYNARTGTLIRGAGSKGPGGVRRLGDLFRQLDLTFDLHSIRADDLFSLLPEEFRAIGRRARSSSAARN